MFRQSQNKYFDDIVEALKPDVGKLYTSDPEGFKNLYGTHLVYGRTRTAGV